MPDLKMKVKLFKPPQDKIIKTSQNKQYPSVNPYQTKYGSLVIRGSHNIFYNMPRKTSGCGCGR